MSETVSAASMVCMVISGVLAIGVPVVLAVYVCRRQKAAFFSVFVGAAGFVVSALIVRVLISSWILSSQAAASFLLGNAVVYALYAGLMAGIFEESGRFAAFMILRKRHDNLSNAIAYGVGHGGIEAILLVGLGQISNLIVASMINRVGVQMLDAFAASQESAAAVQTLLATPAGYYLAGGLERVVTIALHIALSVLVWMAACRHGKLYLYPLAIGLHMLADIPAGLYQYGTFTGLVAVELVYLAITVGVCLLTYKIYVQNIHRGLLRPFA